jgi:acyl transferase domain-containing protein/NAD(P)H-dependent flavin oxidoreductase YrpB (nitropropane dioxygenase family)/NAD(P)-dependent dehydrogenase (short-subunit alcohol dehydrogenase family)
MHGSDVIAIASAGGAGASIAIAACRAGARGVLDLEFASVEAAQADLERLARFTTTAFGVKVAADNEEVFEHLLGAAPDQLAWVLLPALDHPELARRLEQLRQRGLQVWFEVIDLDEARRAEQLGADGLILKGHEAGGRVGTETAFILLQRWQAYVREGGNSTLPVWLQGGIGANTAAAALGGGASGIGLDAQLLLARESGLAEEARRRLSAFDGSETVCVGERLGMPYRVFSRPGLAAVAEAAAEEERIARSSFSTAEKGTAWREVIGRLVKAGPDGGLWLLGQDATLASGLSQRHETVSGIIEAVVEQANENLAIARRLQPLSEGSPLAQRHRTRYPILQGPMTRVSDTAAFAAAVVGAGALPFLALALLRRPEVEKLLRETRELLGEQPWGVGILGFVPPALRQEQIAAVRADRPAFALIAGGRPDQARELEADGITTYLHVPSPGLLRMFLRDGARRFVFEGRECGGHVGPRSGFVLWESMIEVFLEHLGPAGRGEDLAVVFAGGIHDALSAAMIATIAAPLAERGIAIGVLMGTAYLFTHEAVESGAIVPRFQREALHCSDTVLLQTAPGHAIRCAPTPYRDEFEAERTRLQAEGRSHEEIARALEWRNVGRLRIAAKGLDRGGPDGSGSSALVQLSEEDQFARGMYMIGQVACLREEVISMAALHEHVCAGGTRLLEALPQRTILVEEPHPGPCDIAVIGMACFYPGATGVAEYWQNILDRVNAVTEVPQSHWDWRLYYDPDPRAPDKIISKWGGFLKDIPFDPVTFGITPKSVPSIEPLQLFLLEAARQALANAGYAERPFRRDRTAAVLGIGGGGSPLAVAYGFRTCLPLLETVPELNLRPADLLAKCSPFMPEWTEDSFPGILFNVAVGRIANRFNLGGPNYAIDAACGSSLAAVHACVRELEMGTSDLAIALGADTVQTPYAYVAFSKTHALSPKGRCRPFDAAADGIVLSEGIGAVILKRLADAERDGDRIYAVIKGLGASSDGRDKGLTAPRAEGQLRALRRAYLQAGVSPARLGLIEAHGTGTVVGDQTEAQALIEVMRAAGAEPQTCAVGSVKSMIGHTKCAAGIAGLLKTVLALHHRVLPPTLVEKPNPKGNFEDGPVYLNTEPRPWVHGGAEPRLAGVSAFGFGGTNFHAVLAEYQGDYLERTTTGQQHWPAELFVWSAGDRGTLLAETERCRHALAAGASPSLAGLAAATWLAFSADGTQPTLAIVASSLDDLREKLQAAEGYLKSDTEHKHDPRGIFFAQSPADQGGPVAFLFPGQGSQYPDMLAQVALTFPEVRAVLDRAERALQGRLDRPLSRYLYPGSGFTPETERRNREALTRADVAQPAVGAVSLGLLRLLELLGIEAQFLGGHSYGEYVALCAAGALDQDDLIRLSHRRGEVIRTSELAGGMIALDSDAATAEALLADVPGVTVANSNAPSQTVVAGNEEGLTAALARCQAKGIRGQRLPVACAFHSPLVAGARRPLEKALAECSFRAPRRTVYANVTAGPYSAEAAAVPRLLADHLTARVRFREEVEAMYAAGARLFIEVGPQAVLTGLVGQTLRDHPHLAVATDVKGRPGLVQLLHVLGQLVVHGVPVRAARLFQGRAVRPIDLAALSAETGTPRYTATTWMVNSVRSRPVNAPEPRLLGQRHDQPPPASPAKAPVPTKASAAAPSPPAPPRSASVVPPVPSNNGVHTVAADDAAAVMLHFQDLMGRFLETQKAVMSSYLQGTGAPDLNGSLPSMEVSPADKTPDTAHRNGLIPAPSQAAQEEPVPHTNGATPKAPAAAPSAPVTHDRAWLTNRLHELVCQRTGYPREMLGLDVDLEADLGIDSIKRVEILSEMAQDLSGGTEALPQGVEMEKLTGIHTLRGIIDYLASALSRSPSAASANGTKAEPNREIEANGHRHRAEEEMPLQRGLVELVDCPLSASPAALLLRGAVLLTDDGRGIAREMAARLADLGTPTALLHMMGGSEAGEGIFTADLTDPRAVGDLLGRVREKIGAIAGLVHLLPLASAPGGEPWDARARREVKSLYLLARGLGDELRQAGRNGQAFLVAATALGGTFGFGEEALPAEYSPGHGGVLGFTKCLGQEWPEVLVRGVDLDAEGLAAEALAEILLGEMCDRNGPVEVGHRGGRRRTWKMRAAPLDLDGEPAALLEPGMPVLVTGGARGITAAIAVELARRYRPTLLLVGRSPLPAEQEDPDTATHITPAAIKGALIARLEREGRPPAPALVESQYRRLMQDREIRANLAQLRATDATIHYLSMDVRDAAAFGQLLDEVQKRFGPLAGVIHGAGVIEDRLVRDKTPESFDRVFDTKVVSARVLAERLRPDSLRFCAFFASVASRYGNKGQADYAAANEALSKLALSLDRRWPGRVCAIAWGPWSGIGMVAELERHLVQRGLRLISPEEGPELLIAELLNGRKGESEVILGGGAEALVQPTAAIAANGGN